MRIASLGTGECCRYELTEKRRWTFRTALELRVRLGTDPEGVIPELDELHKTTVR
jgi:hypothetical protein